MWVIDRVNAQWHCGTLRLASEGVGKSWQMRRVRLNYLQGRSAGVN
jgi:hypothetical protein